MKVGRLHLCMATARDFFRASLLLLLLGATVVQAATPMQSAGGEHTLALKADGTVWAWGSNDEGQLGDGTTTMRSTPVQIALPGGVLATAVSAGERFSMALGADGFVYAWGYNGQGQLGKGTSSGNVAANWVPVKIASLSDVTAIQTGAYHAIALKAGDVWTWGANWSRQLGRNGVAHDATPGPVAVPNFVGSSNIAVAADGGHTVALRSDGAVFSWGANTSGQLGNGTSGIFPTPVTGVGGSGTLTGVSSLSAGRDYTLALLSSGGLVAWGANWAGQLGDGTTTDRAYPVVVSTTGVVGPVSKIKAGGAHSMLLTSAGAVWAWGHNAVKQLGDGTTTDRSAPVAVSVAPGTPSSIGAGSSHSHVLMADGTVRAWGHDGNGRRGDGERVYRDAAQRLSLINLNAPAAASLALAVGSPGAVAASFTLTSTVAGTAYWVLLTDGQRAPDYAKIKLLQDGAGGAATAGGLTAVAVGSTTLNVTLTPNTAYRMFVYVEPAGCNGATSTVNCSNVTSLDFKASAGNADHPATGTGTPATVTPPPVSVIITDATTNAGSSTGTTAGNSGSTSSTGAVTSATGNSGSSSASKVAVVEYFHAGFGHYFITAAAGEIAVLDSGQMQGWTRTGQSFNVHSALEDSDSAVCRFFSGNSFSPKSSHFYTPSTTECAALKQGVVWQYEGLPFYVQQPVAGLCPAGKQGVYRLYNNGQSGAPNHRYTTSSTIREQMVAQGWILEGVAFCADN